MISKKKGTLKQKLWECDI